MKKKIVCLFLMMVLAIPISFGLSGVTAYADEGDYIKINNVDDLYKVRNDLSSNYKLMKDIDLTEAISEGGAYNYGGIGWEPFGASSSTVFTGVFDGNGHAISGLSMSKAVNSRSGLFWENAGTIENLTVKGTISNSGSNETAINGFIAGCNSGSIINCAVEGNISGDIGLTSGMICGENSGSISKSRSDGTLKFCGGYSGDAGQWGGICGLAKSNATITECFNGTYLDALTGYIVMGNSAGIAGNTDATVSIENCYNTGTIEGKYYEAYYSYDSKYCTPSGIAGGKASITSCYNTGKIVWGTYYRERANVSLSNYEEKSANYKISVNNENIHNCYFLGDSGAGSLNETQMSMMSSFAGFDFDKVWELSAATDYKYPQLRNNMQDPNKHVDIIEWKTQPTKIEFYTDEDIDPTGGMFRAYYIDDTHEDIEVTKDMLSGYDMSQLGVQTVTVTFREGALTYDILTSTRPEVKSLTLETMPDKTEFARGTAFDFTGATAKVEYVNGKTEIIPIPTEECTGGNINQSGTYTITFEKFGKTVTFEVKVVPVKPTGIRIASLPNKTTYIEGQSLDLTGLVVKLDYNSGKTETITDYTVGEYENTVGKRDIAITYEDFTTSFPVEFVEKNLTAIMVTTQPSKAKYVVGEAFDPSGMVVKAVYDNGISEEITDYTVSDMTEATGWQTLTVSYEGKTTTIRVMVEAKELVSIFVEQMPLKMTYIEGETFDSEGMVVKANYNNVFEEEITDYRLSGTTLNKVGESKITVLYEGMTATFNVTVVEKKLVRITVTPPTKTEYIAGEAFDATGMVVKAVYDNGKSESVTDYTVNGFGDSEEDNVVTIEYGGKTSSFMVTIHTPETEWTVTQTPTCTAGGSQELHCAECGKTLKTEDLDALGHDWSEWETIDAPNCTDKGSRKHTCNRCLIEEFEDVDPNGHTWIEEYVVDVYPTCTLEGSESWHCSECGISNPESVRTIEKLPHNLGEWVVTKEENCAVSGVRQRVCADCDYLETEEIPATGNHTFGEWATAKEPTCTESGSKDRECSVCHLVETEEIPATGNHIFSEWATVKEPTCTEPGSKGRECAVCHLVETEEIAAIGKHEYGDWKTIKQPTTTATGVKERTCTVCGNKETAEIPMLPASETLSVKSLWASEHSVGKVKFKWTKKDGTKPTGWNLKYRTRKIGAGGSWSGWTTKSYPASTYEAWINIPVDYVIEIHAQAKGDKTWSTGIITTPAGGKYQAMKTTYVLNTATNKRVGTSLTMNVGQTIKVRPDYEYPVKDYKKRPKLYPNQMLYDVSDKSIISITKPDGSKYTGGMIDGVATIKATKKGTTQIVFRAPNGRTQVTKITVK